ncbi:MAG: hypothetical protein ACYDBJ_08370 [Aggregatilineales bacterium]
MCGIFGVFANAVDSSLFRALGEQNTARGNRAFGVLTFDGAGCTVTRQVGPFDANVINVDRMRAVLGHVRAPTDGRADDPTAVHPFETRDLYLAHNGLLLNHADFAQWRIPGMATVDSTVIIGGIQRQLDAGQPIVEAIRQTVEPLDGQQACWLWHKPTHKVYLWRIMAPIYCVSDTASLTFSSVRHVPDAALLREGAIYRIDPMTWTLEECGPFACYNPFSARRN